MSEKVTVTTPDGDVETFSTDKTPYERYKVEHNADAVVVRHMKLTQPNGDWKVIDTHTFPVGSKTEQTY